MLHSVEGTAEVEKDNVTGTPLFCVQISLYSIYQIGYTVSSVSAWEIRKLCCIQ